MSEHQEGTVREAAGDSAGPASADPGLDLSGPVPLTGLDPSSPTVREAHRVTVSGIFGPSADSFGRYLHGRELARGGMGAVFKVLDPELERDVALKVVLPGAEPSAYELRKFLAEARITGQLEHPNIVPVHELGRTPEGRPYFTMKLVRGRSMAQAIRELRGKNDDAIRARAGFLAAFLKVCDAMAFAHSRGVIHRDLKPANVMLGEYGEVLVMDWGLARVRGVDDPESDARLSSSVATLRSASTADPGATKSGMVLGTPAYMPPEQAAGEIAAIDERSDVYSLGAILYEVLTLSPPHTGSNAAAILARIAEGKIEPPSARAPELSVPRELEAVILKAMALDPGARYQKVEDLAAEISAYLGGRTLTAARYTTSQRIRKLVARNRLASVVVAIASAVVLSVSALFVWRLYGERRAALEAKTLAEEKSREAEARLADYQRMDDVKRLADSVAAAGDLWPAHPEKISDLEAWLAEARDLMGRLETHRAALEATEDPRTREVLAGLVSGIEDLGSKLLPDVEKRLENASTIEERTIGRYRDEWNRAIVSIANPLECPRYRGLVISPQVGLVPIGRDPDSRLWEFAVSETGDIPERNADGRLVLTETTALALVLLPGGTFRMGAERIGRSKVFGLPNVDPQAESNEGPVHEVALDPFFISKYEMTQGQWMFVTGENPSSVPPGSSYGNKKTTLLHPVESVTWDACVRTLRRIGFDLPTEAQWEYSARAETSTPWSTGEDARTLDGAANLADQSYYASLKNERYEKWVDDGYAKHAPVGSYRANDFGLFDSMGNVWEWCSDLHGGADDYKLPLRAGDGGRLGVRTESKGYVSRGGSHRSFAVDLRIALRAWGPPRYWDDDNGLRPARSLDKDGPSRSPAGGTVDPQSVVDFNRLADLDARGRDLWPAHPGTVPSVEAWIADARDLLSRIENHRAELAATPDPVFHSIQAALVAGLDILRDQTIPEVEARISAAAGIEERTIEKYRAEWDRAIASIADPAECPMYKGLRIHPQVGLVPIDRDSASGLWEFAHAETGELATRDAAGWIHPTARTGLVFVLVPGGTFHMGAEKPSDKRPAGSPNADPDASNNEGPVHEVTLAPFLLSKYEMTQGQWLAATGENPSEYGPGSIDGERARTLLHPVETVSWDECSETLRKLGLLLPTEAQWEYAARGGTTTPWWTGESPETLRGATNLEASPDDPMDDGWTKHSPVATFRPNPFGLHDVAGNVWEWCRDESSEKVGYELPERGSDGLRASVGFLGRANRGGAFTSDTEDQRVANRRVRPSDTQDTNVGVRPVRALAN
ncbi:MAG: SUMF1/EgtB/PvdO family nonheme iron enzyme [Planctomycetes bacterium]|nr:SUMF1/EgtB/PvdO family nonheme iron enzyme [Planctomycetota bacterium]